MARAGLSMQVKKDTRDMHVLQAGELCFCNPVHRREVAYPTAGDDATESSSQDVKLTNRYLSGRLARACAPDDAARR